MWKRRRFAVTGLCRIAPQVALTTNQPIQRHRPEPPLIWNHDFAYLKVTRSLTKFIPDDKQKIALHAEQICEAILVCLKAYVF